MSKKQVTFADIVFGADHTNVQPHSGASANYAVYQALCNVGDTVMGMNLDNGGHLTHGSPVNYSGINYKIVPYGVDPKTHRIDYDQVRDLAKQCKPKMIIAGASAYPRIIDFKAFREIADEVDFERDWLDDAPASWPPRRQRPWR